AFVALLILLFALSFVIAYNMLGGRANSGVKVAELEQIIEEQQSTIDDLRELLGLNETPEPGPMSTEAAGVPTATAKPAVTAAPKPTATARPAATTAPKPTATPRPVVVQPTNAPVAPATDRPFVNLD
ncbi:MAG: hypothetical protein FWE47_04345, partial [Oscillospiraceae bacterium]|nr:hypothetical protein [Oscillospiraceae bacterium]